MIAAPAPGETTFSVRPSDDDRRGHAELNGGGEARRGGLAA